MNALNPQQQTIVEHMTGPALVIAGAGSGKTRVITHRVAHLIEQGVAPSAIMMVTFTNKAAEEMLHRAEGMLKKKEQAGHIFAGTFHSLANRFLRRYAKHVGFENNFSILDDSDSRDLIRAAIAEVNPKTDKKFPTAAVVQSAISMSFNRNYELHEYVEREAPWLQEFLGDFLSIREAYDRKKQANNAMDFDDLLAYWHLLLTNNPQLDLTKRLQYIMVDEYQDTNVVQAEILEMLAREHGNLMVVGDDAQSIYGWRGANFANILAFPERFGGETYRLEENYRSSPNILELANHSINKNTNQFEKQLFSVRPAAERATAHFLYDQYQEADLIVEEILSLADQEIPLKEIGVLYRGHAQSAILQMRLTERGIPFVVRSGIKFFEQAHIKDVVAFLKIVFNPLDEIAWMRILKMLPGIGNATAQKIYRIFQNQRAVRLTASNLELNEAIPKKAQEAWQTMGKTFKTLIADQIPPSEMIDRVRTGFYHDFLYTQYENPDEREGDLKYLGEFSQKYRSLERFLAQLALVGSTVIRDYEEETSEEEDYLTLTTIHQAKGLEWEAVFVIGLAEGKFPHAKSLEPVEKLEEERRLFYVAVTRCRRFLELTIPLVTFQNGMSEICRPSRFVEELPQDILEINRSSGTDSFDSQDHQIVSRNNLMVDY